MYLNQARNNAGFTLIELAFVMTIIMAVIMAVAPGLNAIASSDVHGIRLAYTDVVYNLQSALGNASSGFGGLSVEKGENEKVELLPEDFMVAFQSDSSNTARAGGMLNLSAQTRKSGSSEYTRIIQKESLEYKHPGLYLRKIIAKRDDADTGVEVGSFVVSFRNPTGNMSFFFDNQNFFSEGNVSIQENKTDTINEFPRIPTDKTYNRVDLEFYNPDEKRIFTIKIYKDKQFYVDLN